MNKKEAQKITMARHQFSMKYCQDKGWDIADITLKQILEIRKQPDWIKPCLK